MQNNSSNLVTEISVLILSVAILAAMTILFYVGKINYIEAIPFLTVVASLFGVNFAFKAPSPSQMQQLNSQQENLTQLALQMANTHAALLSQAHTHAEPVQASVDTTTVIQPPTVQPAQQFIDYGRHWGDSQVMPVVTPQ